MFHLKQTTILLGLALGTTQLLNPAWAQTTKEAELPEVKVEAQTVRPGTPRDTVFTGSKTDTALRDLPASVVVVTAENLAEQGVKTMNQAMENISGVQAQMAGGYGFADNYTVRGLSMRFMRDGLPDGTSQNGYTRSMFDIDRIEVLKGPGSALYGSGQPGGTINVVSKAPQFKSSAEVYGAVGSFGTKITSVDVTGALNKEVAARVVAGHEESDGWRGLSRKIDEVSPSLLWKLADDKQVNIDLDHREIKIKPDNYGTLFNSKGQLSSAGREAHYNSPMDYSTQNIDRLTLSHDWRVNSDLSMRTALVQDQRDLSFLRNGGGNGGNAANQMTGREIRQQTDKTTSTTLQNELIYKLGEGPVKHTLLGGIEYNTSKTTTKRTSYALSNITNIDNPVIAETSLAGLTATQSFDRTLESNTWSLYAQDQIALGEQFKLRAGMRQDRVDFSDKGLQLGTYRAIVGNQNLNSGSLGGVWQPSQNWSFYTGVSSGRFINMATESNAISLQPESSTQGELGAKATLLDGRLGLNAALFNTRRNNYYITLPGASSATPDGQDKSKGVEFDLTSEPIKGLNLLANFAIQDAEVTSNATATNAAMGVTTARSIAGTRPTGVARESGRIWASYTLQQGEFKGLGFGLGTSFKGTSYADSLNLYKVPGYAVLDAAIFYKQPKWEVALNVKNLTDRTYYTNPTFVGALPGEARNALLSLRLKMD